MKRAFGREATTLGARLKMSGFVWLLASMGGVALCDAAKAEAPPEMHFAAVEMWSKQTLGSGNRTAGLSRVLPVRAPRRERRSIPKRSVMDLAAKVPGEPRSAQCREPR